MRRFFNRLATGNGGSGGGGGGGGAQDDSAATQQRSWLDNRARSGDRSGGAGGLHEKVGLNNSDPTPLPVAATGDRVRGLAAKYETLNKTSAVAATLPSSEWQGPQSVARRTQQSRGGQDAQNGQAPQTSETERQHQSMFSPSSGVRKKRSPLFNFDKPLPTLAAGLDGSDAQSRSLPLQLPHTVSASSSQDMLNGVLGAGDDKDDVGQSTSAHAGPSAPHLLPSALRSNSDSRQTSDASAESNGRNAPPNGGSTSAQYAPAYAAPQKTVAFAPSPKKPTRPSSPLADMPDGYADEIGRYTGMSPSSSAGGTHQVPIVGNFAKPTVASTARARSGGRLSLQAVQQHQPSQQTSSLLSPSQPFAYASSPMSSSARQTTEKFPVSSIGMSRPSSAHSSSGAPRMSRSNSTSATSRRGASGGSSQGHGTNGAAAAASSSISLVHGARESTGVQFPNSIPFASTSTTGMLRSASPHSIASSNGVLDFLGGGRTSMHSRFHSGGSSQFASSIRSIGAPSWSEMTSGDLVNNLGARERTRQEVLWEIVASEERYVQELEKTRDFFLDALMHPHRFSPPGSPGAVHAATLAALEGRTEASTNGTSDGAGAEDGIVTQPSAELPIASRFMSPSSGLREAAPLDASAQRKSGPRSPYGAGLGQTSSSAASRPANGVVGLSSALSAQMRGQGNKDSSPSLKLERRSIDIKNNDPGAAKRWSDRQRKSRASSTQIGYDLTNGQGGAITLPAPLRSVLAALDGGIIEGHALLSEALRLRYEEQWPLVRSLADIFTRFSYVLKHYHAYVLHLERALDCLEEAALMERAMRGKRIRKERLPVSVALGRAVATLEAAAAERGECGLAIFLSMPFQRLLKYPLLFQNLLFHTDASTFEFESTVQMVVDVERIVRSIEDDKINKEERDKAIDAFARIEGIKDRALLRPKADRILIEERAMYQENPRRALSESNEGKSGGGDVNGGGQASTSTQQDAMTASRTAMSTSSGIGSGNLRASIRNKRSYRRLSDLLTLGSSFGTGQLGDDITYTKAPNMGSKRDIWLIRFSDVELRCQRVGVTALPLISSTALQPESVGAPVNAAVSESIEDEDREGEADAEARMRDEFKRTKESKERMRALRNTTLRSKTRNLYRFLGVSSWKATRDKPSGDDVEQVDGLATAHEEDEEEEDGGEDGSGDESVASQETDGGMLDHEHYVRQSKLSFSYAGNDRVEPKVYASAGGPAGLRGTSLSTSSARFTGRRGTNGSMAPPVPIKRHSVGSSSTPGGIAASNVSLSHSNFVVATSKSRADKFGSRLRPDEQHQRRGSLPNVAMTASQHASHLSAGNALGPRDTAQLAVPEQAALRGRMFSEDDADGRSRAMLESSSSDAATSDSHPRPFTSFVRDRSMDSNLRLMGTLIESGTGAESGPHAL